MEELNIKPREYQEKIFQITKEKNTLVVLPTGTGKTLIAIMQAVETFKTFPLKKVVILAPTKPLIEQHLESFTEKLPDGFADMQLFTGSTNAEKRKKIWQTAEFVFSTPQCIANDLEKRLYNLNDVALLVVDEAHRCVKNYAYNKVAQHYNKTYTKNPKEKKILALTASPGSDKKSIQLICENLNIEAVEIRTRDSPDVKQYLQELEFQKIEVDYPTELIEIRGLLEELYNTRIAELKARKVIFHHPNKIELLKLQGRLMMEIKETQDGNKMKAVSATAQALKVSHAIELIETQTVNSFLEYMRDLYKQSAEKKSKGVQKLCSEPLFTKAYTLATTLGKEHPKIEELNKLVKEQIKLNPESRIIIFAQFRETVRTITEMLNKIDGVHADTFVGQAMKENSRKQKTGLKQKEQKEMIERFKRLEINILVATSIAEEGLDIPEVSMVVFYEPIPSAIRKIQRAGRTARLSNGKLKILITKKTRDEVYHYASYHKEKRMHKAIQDIKKDFTNKGPYQKAKQTTLL
ncbi:MAG: ERCC4-related helicase [Patescibacteria group bacterium]|jgi:ERCC4-related helicase